MKKINVEFTIDDEMYNDYEDILTDFENNLSSIGVEEINTYETHVKNKYIGKIAEIINTEDEDLNDFIEDFCERHKLDSNSLFVLITDQEDENLWGEIIGSKEELPYHFEVKDVACFYH